MKIDDNQVPAIVCDICKTYVATAKPGAAAFGVSAAFAAACTIHTYAYHKNNKDKVTYSYGLREVKQNV